MKVIVASAGKFHALRLAEQLDKRGHLHKLLTEYYSRKNGWLPPLRDDRENISLNKVATNFIPALIERGMKFVPRVNRWTNWSLQAAKVFDAWASQQIEPCDLVVAWSSSALRTLVAAKKSGAVSVVERGSSHILFQKAILEEEFNKYGIRRRPVDDRVCEQEMEEYQEADYISLPSRFAVRTFLGMGTPPEKIIQVPYGTDLSRFYPLPKEDRIFRIIHCGGLTLQKGVHYLLQAFFELNLSDSELWLIGSWSEEMAPFLRKYDNGRVFHKGPFPEKSLPRFYSQGSVFCLASIQEGLALATLQAMACVLPVVATTNTGAEDLIEDGKQGFIIPIRDVPILKEKILYLYKHERERKLMGEAAFQRAKEFSWDSYGEKIIAAYEKVVTKRQGRR